MTWGVPVSNTQKAELFAGFTGEGARSFLNPCVSRKGKPLADASHGRDQRETRTCSWLL